jgi:hypothetical protein
VPGTAGAVGVAGVAVPVGAAGVVVGPGVAPTGAAGAGLAEGLLLLSDCETSR